MLLRLLPVAFVLTCAFQSASGQTVTLDSLSKKTLSVPPDASSSSIPAKWYDRISLKGYAQFRYNRLLETNPDLKCDQCDKGIGKGQEFEFRRARLVLSGDVHDRLFMYLQFDYSADATVNNKHFLQVRDAYFDLALDKKKSYRIRFGQSKVPFGFENLLSSSNRLPFDRSDALNSAVPNERDFGAFFMYAPEKIRTFYKHNANDAMKGSGDYGVFTVGLFNGQCSNKPELNDNLHVVARLTYPFKVGKQIIEPGIQAYTGKYTVGADQRSIGVKFKEDQLYTDRRVAGTLVLYPQPFGFLAEYNVGESPTFNKATDSIQVEKLNGGFITAFYRNKLGKGFIMPYARYQVYDGAKKHELDARRYNLNELELGLEWQPFKNLEITLAYVISQRKYSDFKSDYDEKGNFMRIQVQTNY